jgi:HSP20 family protein
MALPVRRVDGADGAETAQWDPFDEIQRLSARLQSLLSGAGVPDPSIPFTPLADVEETDDAYLIELELPGIAKDDVTVEVAGGRVAVSGERKERQRVGILRRRTRSVGRFHYEVTLPGEVDDDQVTAAMDVGVLTVRVPKPPDQRRRRIPIG